MDPNDVLAFPHTEWTHGGGSILSEQQGMTLRDYFAAKAMQGIQASPVDVTEPDGSPAPDILTDAVIARLSYALADAMLAAREQS